VIFFLEPRTKSRLGAKGFTLVELMIVVAIIGILASIAIPNFQKYQARARQREANIALGGMYTALRSFSAEYSTFTACLRQAGFAPENSNGNSQAASAARYYYTGFASLTLTSTCGSLGNQSCGTFSWDGSGSVTANGTCSWGTPPPFGQTISLIDIEYPATAKAFSTATITEGSTLVAAGSAVSQNSFTAAAGGSISSATAVLDLWTINEGKYMRNVTNGAN
jgi:prepilin-type N-terminal cleavage/methylation domain-containing protein